jgi:hypothetical protein
MNYEYRETTFKEADEDPMSWTTPRYSKKAVGRAGKSLISPASMDEYIESLEIMNNWRAAHAYPLNSLTNSLRYRARQINSDITISQRLKRVESIKGKLNRFQGMQLHRMQDIGGCRAIMPSVQEVYTLRDLMRKDTGSELVSEDDYIENPKASGYRGVHLIYKYKSKSKKQTEHNGLFIEVQIRSPIQHAWATTVEIAGTFLGKSLKSGEGPEDWLNFFSLSGALFSTLENEVSNEVKNKFWEVKEEVKKLSQRITIIEQLKAFSTMTEESNHIGAEAGYFLLELRIEEMTIGLKYYPKGSLKVATEDYTMLEEAYKGENINVVLVAAESLATLRKSYPNYFADSRMFISVLERLIGIEN